MGSLTWIAIDARGEAEQRRADAEGLIKFMLTDLRDRLEPVGRLDVLDAVGQQASDYYDGYEESLDDPDALGRRAETLHLLGDIQLRRGNIAAAKSYFDPAFEITRSQLKNDPKNPQRIYEHAQSVYWMSPAYRRQGDYETNLRYQKRIPKLD